MRQLTDQIVENSDPSGFFSGHPCKGSGRVFPTKWAIPLRVSICHNHAKCGPCLANLNASLTLQLAGNAQLVSSVMRSPCDRLPVGRTTSGIQTNVLGQLWSSQKPSVSWTGVQPAPFHGLLSYTSFGFLFFVRIESGIFY